MNNKKQKSSDRTLTPSERRGIEAMESRSQNDHDLFRSVGNESDSTRKVEPVYKKGLQEKDALTEFQSRIYSASGAANMQVGFNILTKACEAVTNRSASLDETVRVLNTLAKAMQALEPQDEVEGQLIAQLVVIHEHCMIWLGKAMSTDRVDFANTYLNGASKLLARHHETLTTLLKYRRGDEQRVHVEHVHVHDGGKAIVGTIETGGGSKQKTEEGPHAKV